MMICYAVGLSGHISDEAEWSRYSLKTMMRSINYYYVNGMYYMISIQCYSLSGYSQQVLQLITKI